MIFFQKIHVILLLSPFWDTKIYSNRLEKEVMAENSRYMDGKLFLKDVREKIRLRLEEIKQSLDEGQKEIESMHEYYWENYTEMDQYGYEDYDNQQALLNQVNANQDRLALKHRFERMADSPFFGRVDFVFDGVARRCPFCGRHYDIREGPGRTCPYCGKEL